MSAFDPVSRMCVFCGARPADATHVCPVDRWIQRHPILTIAVIVGAALAVEALIFGGFHV